MTIITVITGRCIQCGKAGEIQVDTKEYDAWQAGAMIQNAMPSLSADQREQLISGTHPECFKKLFGDEDDRGANDGGEEAW